MAQSRHLEICEAIKSVLDADTWLTGASGVVDSWSIVKRFWNRSSFTSIKTRGFIAPLRRNNPVFENLKVRWDCPVLAGIMMPSDGSVRLDPDVADEDILIQASERIEDIFGAKGKNTLPSAMKSIGQSRTPDTEKFSYEMCNVRTGDPYIEPAILAGMDAVAVLITVTIQFNKKNFSSL